MNYIEEIRAGLKETFDQRIKEVDGETFISLSDNSDWKQTNYSIERAIYID